MAKEGYVYIYKCIVGSASNVVKIGVTSHFRDRHDRIQQHLRTPYYGFIPYADFNTGEPIATGFKVNDITVADVLVKDLFKNKQLGDIEIYNVDYKIAIKMMYDLLVKNEQFIGFKGDGITDYSYIMDTSSIDLENTTKNNYELIKNYILLKYEKLPDSLIYLLRPKKDLQEKCFTHLAHGNFITFPNDLILDIHVDKKGRLRILNQLYKLLQE